MIKSKKDLKKYLDADRRSLGLFAQNRSILKEYFAPNVIWKFQKKLRYLEYYTNTGVNSFYYKYKRLQFEKYAIKLGFSIPVNVFGPGLAIVHYGTIIVNKNARIGKNCRIHANTNIGASGGKEAAPIIGDNVYIAPGAKIFGNINIPSNCAIGANAVVNKTMTEQGMLIAGIPAQSVKKIDITSLIKTAN